MTTRAEIVAAARTWVGTPWMHQKSLKGCGADCVGLLRGVALESGVIALAVERSPAATQFAGYGRKPYRGLLEKALGLFTDPLPTVREAGVADILLMRFEGDPQHLALISSVDPLRIIHSYARGVRKVAEHGINGEYKHGVTWRSLIVSAWRFRGIE